MSESLEQIQHQLLTAAIECQALRFGQFTLKSGRISPYFFNAGLFNSGAALAQLAQSFAARLHQSGLEFDLLFGPAYKGITLASATAVQLSLQYHRSVGYCYNRKEAKDHGEGGLLVGAPLRGRVVIVDDVISAGTSVRESVQIIEQVGAQPVAVLVALDRQERGSDANDARSATQEVSDRYGIPVLAVANLDALLRFVEHSTELCVHRDALQAYRQRYGACADL